MGGRCTKDNRPLNYTLNDLKNLKIGEIKVTEPGKGCTVNIAGIGPGSGLDYLKKEGLKWPNNGEFDWGGYHGKCQTCSSGWGCECSASGKGIAGTRGSIKRVDYKADPAECCIKQTDIIGNYTCDPKYKDGFSKSDCDNAMLAYCNKENDKKWTSPECRRWVQNSLTYGRPIVNTHLSDFCSEGVNFKTNVCQEWCKQVRGIKNMESACDNASEAYCTNNPTDDKCACFLPPDNVSEVEKLMNVPKVCWYQPCKNSSNDIYISSAMHDTKKTCTSNVCTIQAGDIKISGTGNRVEFTNDCVSTIIKPQYTDNITISHDPSSPQPPPPEPDEEPEFDLENDSDVNLNTDQQINPDISQSSNFLQDNYIYIIGSICLLSILIITIIIVIIIIASS